MKAFVSRAGFLTTVQDAGRNGFRKWGVSPGGALDSFTMRLSNILVGNDEAAAGLEATLGNLRIEFSETRVVTWCGGAFEVRVGERNVPPGHVTRVDAGEQLAVSAPKIGSRAWLAISGGVDVAQILGSRATDLRAQFGGLEGRALRDGDTLALGRPSELGIRIAQSLQDSRVADWSVKTEWVSTARRDRFLRIVRGSDWPRFDGHAQSRLTSEPFAVTADSDRMGARLKGPILGRTEKSDLLSEAVVAGTLQVPPSGNPILLLGGCQTVGGYPKIAHVITVDLPVAAQLWPGDLVRFHEVSLAEAHELLLEREDDLARFRIGMELQIS